MEVNVLLAHFILFLFLYLSFNLSLSLFLSDLSHFISFVFLNTFLYWFSCTYVCICVGIRFRACSRQFTRTNQLRNRSSSSKSRTSCWKPTLPTLALWIGMNLFRCRLIDALLWIMFAFDCCVLDVAFAAYIAVCWRALSCCTGCSVRLELTKILIWWIVLIDLIHLFTLSKIVWWKCSMCKLLTQNARSQNQQRQALCVCAWNEFYETSWK